MRLIYVNMRDNYVKMQNIYVNMREKYFYVQVIYDNMQDSLYVGIYSLHDKSIYAYQYK